MKALHRERREYIFKGNFCYRTFATDFFNIRYFQYITQFRFFPPSLYAADAANIRKGKYILSEPFEYFRRIRCVVMK